MEKIKGKGFILRRIKKSDFDSWWKNINDKTIAKNFVTNPRNLREAKKEFNDKLKGKKDSDSFIIDVGGKAIGGIGLHNIILKLKAKISFWVGKDYRGKGIATTATKLIVNHGFRKLKLRRIYANVREYNKASARVLKKNGFKLEGIQKKNVLKSGKYYDDYLYAKTK
jgi:RimJ/RimL family protein N-acetyltransferase